MTSWLKEAYWENKTTLAVQAVQERLSGVALMLAETRKPAAELCGTRDGEQRTVNATQDRNDMLLLSRSKSAGRGKRCRKTYRGRLGQIDSFSWITPPSCCQAPEGTAEERAGKETHAETVDVESLCSGEKHRSGRLHSKSNPASGGGV
ncbi:hypothetical protein EYF80_008959 [Liparis tanakae]|uniref:Uncharacterized protein n=1 Tax=Liparis tanakae TaxID=230148 RepID=A0A4Z2IS57_9TELE|nr:hypothetical protein EYF80_008959 [Liparis tanakae]